MATLDIDTEDKLEYKWFPITAHEIHFQIRAPHDCHVALTQGPFETDRMYEIFLGGWKNTKSIIRVNRTKPDVCEVPTEGILNEYEYRSFWIRWGNGLVEAGIEGVPDPVLSYRDPYPFEITHFGLCTGWGASGSWKIEATNTHGRYQAPQPGFNIPSQQHHQNMHGVFNWVPATSGQVPPGAVVGGHDNGEPTYVIRAHHEGGVIPGKLLSSHGCAYIAWGGAEHGKNEYEVLCNCESKWEPSSNGNVPPGAIPGGQSENGDTLFIGRAHHDGKLIPGKLQCTHGVLYVPYGGEEVGFPEYEVLVH